MRRAPSVRKSCSSDAADSADARSRRRRLPVSCRSAARRRRVLLGAAALALGILTSVVSASATETIAKTSETHSTATFTRAADGTITAEVAFSSSNPHCLPAYRFQRSKGRRVGEPKVAFGFLLAFGGPSSGRPFGADGYANPPSDLEVAPASPPNRSPYVFRVVLPGDANVYRQLVFGGPRYPATVSQATGVVAVYYAVGTNGNDVFKARRLYRQGGHLVRLTCTAGARTGAVNKLFVL